MKTFYLNQYREAIKNAKTLSGEKKDTQKLKKILDKVYKTLINEIKSKYEKEDLIDQILLCNYCMYVVMIESRNKVWPYNNLDFSRRIGELWEPFCKLCWSYPINESLTSIEPIKFNDAKLEIIEKFLDKVKGYNLSQNQMDEINHYNNDLWDIITSGAVNLKSDLHFSINEKKYNLDFKSGFNSNEKGNLNRLLLVGKIYNLLNENYINYIFVRSESDENNHYLRILEKSGIWEVYAGSKCYEKIKEITGIDLKKWIINNINWLEDLNLETREYLLENKLDRYLLW